LFGFVRRGMQIIGLPNGTAIDCLPILLINFSSVVGIKFYSESRFGESNRLLFQSINRTNIKRNDIVLVRAKRLNFFFPSKKSKRRRFITHVNRFNQLNRPRINRLNQLNRSSINRLTDLTKINLPTAFR
jgi:hypothetical protein